MTLHEAQETVDLWIKEYGVRYFSELTNMAMLTEEVGEVAPKLQAQRPRQAARRRTGRRAIRLDLPRQPNRH